MDKPSERARAYLEEYRASLEPTAATVAAQRRRILERAARGDLTGVDVAAATSSRRWGRIVAVPVAVAAAVALLFVGVRELVDRRIEHHLHGEAVMQGGRAAGAFEAVPAAPAVSVDQRGGAEVVSAATDDAVPAPVTIDDDDAPTTGDAAAAVIDEAPTTASTIPATSDEAATSASTTASTSDAAPTTAATPSSRRPSRARPSTPAEPPPIDPPGGAADEVELGDLKAESALLARARKALQDGDPAAALGPLERHAARFPDGLLAEERLALAATARCRSGDLTGGRRLAGELAERFPGSLLAGRVREACAGDQGP